MEIVSILEMHFNVVIYNFFYNPTQRGKNQKNRKQKHPELNILNIVPDRIYYSIDFLK